MTERDLGFDADGYLEMDQFDDEPLGFVDRRAADRLLRAGSTAGLLDDWRGTLLTEVRVGGAVVSSEPIDVVDLPVAVGVESRSRPRVLRAIAAAAIAVIAALGLAQILSANPPSDVATAPPPTMSTVTSVPSSPVTTSSGRVTTTTLAVVTPPETVPPSATTALTTPPTVSTAEPTTTTAVTTTVTPTTTVTAPTTTTLPPAPPTVSIDGPDTIAPADTADYTAAAANYEILVWDATGSCQIEMSNGVVASVRAAAAATSVPCVVEATVLGSDGSEASASKNVTIG